MLFTSYYSNRKRDIPGVAISNMVPSWAVDCEDWEPKLAPPWKMMPKGPFASSIIGREAWVKMYEDEVLSRFNPATLLKRFDGKAMMCFEKPGDWCHRRMVADWIQRKTGVFVPEWGHEPPPPDNQIVLF